MLTQPAASRLATWPAKSWSRAETRAYPTIIFNLTFGTDIWNLADQQNRVNKNLPYSVSFGRRHGRERTKKPRPGRPGRTALLVVRLKRGAQEQAAAAVQVARFLPAV